MPRSPIHFKPTRADLLAAKDKTVRDVIAPGLRVLFCGINPGLYSGATGHHFARPGNRFWPTLHQAGFTPRLLHPSEERELLDYGYGITNLVTRATATADELAPEELVAGRRRLEAKVKRYQPNVVAVLGIGAYRTAFAQKVISLGQQAERLANAVVWVLPNPSGLNANYQLSGLVEHFQVLRRSVEGDART
jgi:double-stranded uracil-DNA glycosylase